MEGIKKAAVEVPQDLIDHSKSRLLETASLLRKVRDENRDEFRSVATKLRMRLRKAYHLAQIDEALSDMDIPAERMQRLGWTKLSILAAYGKKETIDDLLDVAEDCTAHELKMYIHKGGIDPGGRTVVLHFDKEQYALLEEALRAKGAEPHPRGLLGKEAALMRLVTESLAGSASK
ncbi:hypothetical protein [Sphingosinicella xenopeptidilytica]|uniref:Uncharacterized protein n=1 Tax=Sphingosinicella xenopeptidilytica TaxID=364098 RepID=A0ABW3C4Q6_SPHXN